MPMETSYSSLAPTIHRPLWFPSISANPVPMSFWCKRDSVHGSTEVNRKRTLLLLNSDCAPLDLRSSEWSLRRTSESSQSTETTASSQLFVECGSSAFNQSTVAVLSCDSGFCTSTPASSQSASPSPQPQKNAAFYPIESPQCLTAPYQSMPTAENELYVYTWTLPSSDILADLCALNHSCFTHTDQCLGLIFSKPISENDYVCRVPLYLSQGMARARVHRAGSPIRLTQSELERVVACHRILAELLTNIADLSHVGLQFANLRLRSVVERKNSLFGSKTLAVRDPFEELTFSPTGSRLLGLVTFLQLPSYNLDFLAMENLIRWSEARESWKLSPIAPPAESVKPSNGIVPSCPVRLSQIPTEDWAGIMVRPSHLPHDDPAMFAISGCSSKIGLDPVPPKLSEKLLTVLNPILPGSCPAEQQSPIHRPTSLGIGEAAGGGAVLSYLDYFAIRYPAIHRMVNNFDGTLPMANCFRLTRHQNGAQVTAGLRKDKHGIDDKLAMYLADACAVHPLSAWLWFLLSTFPLVVYQLSRALLMSQFSAELRHMLAQYDPSSENRHLEDGTVLSSRCTVLMPDRLDAPRCMLSELNHFTQIDLEVESHTSEAWSSLDLLAASNVSTWISPHVTPNPNQLFEATTLLAARDAVNLERLELLGDSLLQLVATLNVYSTAPTNSNEGLLSAQRIPLVSNANLQRLSIQFNWPKYCTGQVYSPPSHFVFPCYSVCKTACLPNGDTRTTLALTDKSLADMVEALIGCFLFHLGLSSAVRLLSLFGISPQGNCQDDRLSDGTTWSRLLITDASVDSDSDCASPTDKSRAPQMRTALQTLCSQPVVKKSASDISEHHLLRFSEAGFHIDRLLGLQSIIGYRFKDLSLLIQSLIHISSIHAKQFGNYERLEFLGDAVLGYVVTVYLYHQHEEFDPGKLTESRSNIVSNNSLACAVVEHQIHPYIVHSSSTAEDAVACITCIQDRTTSYSEQLELLNQEVLKGLRVKMLADVFESIVGAIFVDTDGDLGQASRVIHRLLNGRIRSYLEVTPNNPLRLMHLMHSDLKYTELSSTDSEESEGKYKLTATVGGRQIFAYGSTRNEARLALARKLGVSTR